MSLGYTERQQPILRLLQETLDKGPVLAAAAVREAPPEPLSPESIDLFTAPSRLHSSKSLGPYRARAGRVYGQLTIFQNQSGTSLAEAHDQALMRMLASFAACAIESAERVASERTCADAAAARTADQLRQHSGEELRAAVTAAQDEERADVSRRLSGEVDHALDSVLRGLHRIGGPHESSLGISATGNQIDELRSLIADAQWRTRRVAVELRILVADVA